MSTTEPQRRDQRTSDADRTAITERLRDAHIEGRLTTDELDERLEAALQAKTFGDLEPLVRDLPRPAQSRPAPSPSVQPVATAAPAPRRRAMAVAWSAWAVVVGVNLVIWLLVSITNGRPVYFWPMWVAGPWGAIMLMKELSARAGRGCRSS